MNSEQAKQIDMVDLMSRLGYEPAVIRKNGTEYHYKSPFRLETQPSFVVGRGKIVKWVWNDFGDRGGTVIDFIMRLNNYSQVSQALAFLDDLYHGVIPEAAAYVKDEKKNQFTFSFNQQDRAAVKIFREESISPLLELIEAKEITNPIIYAYLSNQRGIPRALASRYFCEVKYRHTPSGKNYFAIGLRNESDGYEIRAASDNSSFTKSCLGKKDISFIAGSSSNKISVNIFEGGIDCLSLMAMYNSDHLSGDSIILNTTQNVAKAEQFIKEKGYEIINTFLDNDRAGEACLNQFRQSFGEKVKPQNDLYQKFNDMNEALVDILNIQNIQKK